MQLPLTSYQRKFDSSLWNVVQPVTEVYHVFTDMDAIKYSLSKQQHFKYETTSNDRHNSGSNHFWIHWFPVFHQKYYVYHRGWNGWGWCSSIRNSAENQTKVNPHTTEGACGNYSPLSAVILRWEAQKINDSSCA